MAIHPVQRSAAGRSWVQSETPVLFAPVLACVTEEGGNPVGDAVYTGATAGPCGSGLRAGLAGPAKPGIPMV